MITGLVKDAFNTEYVRNESRRDGNMSKSSSVTGDSGDEDEDKVLSERWKSPKTFTDTRIVLACYSKREEKKKSTLNNLCFKLNIINTAFSGVKDLSSNKNYDFSFLFI